jgi:hypothetical protein
MLSTSYQRPSNTYIHKHRSRCFGIIGPHDFFFFNVGHTVKVADMRIYQNEHNMLLNFPRCLSILLLHTSKTVYIDAIYNLKLRKT